jgi:hypothetical protein
MRTLLKRALMWAYCHELLSMTAVQWVFDRIDLKGH